MKPFALALALPLFFAGPVLACDGHKDTTASSDTQPQPAAKNAGKKFEKKAPKSDTVLASTAKK